MIFYFSGTGNSEWVAQHLAKALGEEALPIARVMERHEEYVPGEDGAVGFVFPVYAWGPPTIVLQFIEQLRMTRPGYLYFVCTCGDDVGKTADIFCKAIRAKGWTCQAGYSVTMPESYVCLPGFDVDGKDVEERKVQNATGRVDYIAQALKERMVMPKFDCHEGPFPRAKSYFLGWCFHQFLMSPKPWHATEACIGCGKCEKICPVHNITLTERPVWGENCTQCAACYHICPVHAVEYGGRTKNKGQYRRFLK